VKPITVRTAPIWLDEHLRRFDEMLTVVILLALLVAVPLTGAMSY
jgi:hypothetical protein